jgi:hypothetical protein
MGTLNLIVLVLVVVLETKPSDRGRERQRGRGRNVGSWKALFRFLRIRWGHEPGTSHAANKVLPTSRRQGVSSAGKMPAAPCGSWKALSRFFSQIENLRYTLAKPSS